MEERVIVKTAGKDGDFIAWMEGREEVGFGSTTMDAVSDLFDQLKENGYSCDSAGMVVEM